VRRNPVLFTRIRSSKSKDTTVARKGKGKERNREKGRKGEKEQDMDDEKVKWRREGIERADRLALDFVSGL